MGFRLIVLLPGESHISGVAYVGIVHPNVACVCFKIFRPNTDSKKLWLWTGNRFFEPIAERGKRFSEKERGRGRERERKGKWCLKKEKVDLSSEITNLTVADSKIKKINLNSSKTFFSNDWVDRAEVEFFELSVGMPNRKSSFFFR